MGEKPKLQVWATYLRYKHEWPSRKDLIEMLHVETQTTRKGLSSGVLRDLATEKARACSCYSLVFSYSRRHTSCTFLGVEFGLYRFACYIVQIWLYQCI